MSSRGPSSASSWALCLLLVGLGSPSARAAPDEPLERGEPVDEGELSAYDRGRVTFDVANDDFGSDLDQGFTSGIEVSFRFTPGPSVGLRKLDPGIERRTVSEHWGLLLGHQIHTPAKLQEIDLENLVDDRRYAGWLYGTLFAELGVAGSPFMDGGYAEYRAGLTVGATGPQIETEALHRYWHAFIRDVANRRQLPEDPRGWGVYQVPNHIGVNLELAQEAEIYRFSLEDAGLRKLFGSQLGFRVASLVGARVGNMFVDAELGATLRAGLMPEVVFDRRMLPVDPEVSFDLPLAIFGFVTGRVIGSAYDALLDGPPGAEGHYPERNHVLTRLEAGFGVRISLVELMFRHTTLSPDLKNRPPGGTWIQNYGRITLSFAFY